MARKATTPKAAAKAPASVAAPSAKPAAPVIVASTPVRNTPIPKVAAAAPVVARSEVREVAREVTHEQIAQRAREIWQSGTGGSDLDNWARAERELRGV
jgi:hypothetical protein